MKNARPQPSDLDIPSSFGLTHSSFIDNPEKNPDLNSLKAPEFIINQGLVWEIESPSCFIMPRLSAFFAPKHPVRADGSSFLGSLPRLLVRLCLACLMFAAAAFPAHGLQAVFNAATDIPVTASSYTATGKATFTLNFAPTPGTNLTVIKNTGLPFITGQFSNLANGAMVELPFDNKIYRFIAWYYGGQGNNDLVLLWPHTGLASWGSNQYGQLGDGTTTYRSVPGRVEQEGVLQGKTIVQVDHGGRHSLALCSDGTVAAWGDNTSFQLGAGIRLGSQVPVAVLTAGSSALAGKTVVSIAAGGDHNLALCSDGTVVAWGSKGNGVTGSLLSSTFFQ